MREKYKHNKALTSHHTLQKRVWGLYEIDTKNVKGQKEQGGQWWEKGVNPKKALGLLQPQTTQISGPEYCQALAKVCLSQA